MFRIWAKIYKEERITRQNTFEFQETFSYSEFFSYLSKICDGLDIPTPVLLKPHIFNYAKFRHVVFRPSDFMESVNFEKLVLEKLD